MSKTGLAIIALLLLASVIPFAFVARSRATKSPTPAINVVADMDLQSKVKTQTPSPIFADGRSERGHIEGTYAIEDFSLEAENLNDPVNPRLVDGKGAGISLSNPTLHATLTLGRNRPEGMTDEQFNAAKPVNISNPKFTDADLENDTFYVKTIPAPIHVTADFLHRGQERFNIYCAPCHGESGYGDGPVNAHAQAIKAAPSTGRDAGGWTQPQDLNQPKIRMRPDGHIFNTITNGIRTMPSYDKQISILDRWAIIAYLRALEKSQNENNVPLPVTTEPAAKP